MPLAPFPDTPGGAQSRVLFQRLFELFGADGPLRLTFLSVGGRRIAAGIHFETPDGILYYNAGVDPDARELSPGVVMVHAYVVRALERGAWFLSSEHDEAVIDRTLEVIESAVEVVQ